MSSARALPLFLLTSLIAAVAACGGSSGDCSSGQGTLAVALDGLPTGATGTVVLSGPNGKQSVTSAQSLTLPSGSYTVSAPLVTTADARVRKAYSPAFSTNAVQICDGSNKTLDVTWSLLPTSNKIFFENENGSDDLLAFSADDAASSGSPAPVIAAKTRGGASSAAFDKLGNLWVANGIAGQEALERYPAALFASGETKTPDIVLSSADFSGGTPGVGDIAFDPGGNLWVSIPYANEVVCVEASKLVATATVTSSTKISGHFGALAFDSTGTLWIGADDHVLAFTGDHLTGVVSTPDLDIQAQTPGPTVTPLAGAQGLAFDGFGDLWVNFDGSLANLAPADRAASTTVTPAVIVQSDVVALPVGLAFDESGDLCLALAQGQVGCFASAQLAASISVAPAVVLSSSQIGSAISPVMFPAPGFSPLFSSLP